MSENLITIRAWGDYACFTRPEMKVERVSYPVMTPSAARGLLEAIFWEPQIYYLIDAIHVIQRGDWFSFRRNEVEDAISLSNSKTWMKEPHKTTPIRAGGGIGTQRSMLALASIEYLITAEVHLTDLGKKGRHPLKTYLDEIKRRSKNGKCYHRPYLGVREFAADFEWEEDAQAALERRAAELGKNWQNIWFEEELGLMLYDVFDHEQRVRGFQWLTDEPTPIKKKMLPRWDGQLVKPEAAFFHANIKNSKLDCHPQRVRLVRNRLIER
ncbi:type I-C CRISPR-associated protein Cas5c [Candidatus Methylospira mobilis]|uniref:type I-C CRISPR-associated protein Cas5c n=1 Tax=Candidatus Methylospira mobilis TaxID=1808979 RepID=UPI0028E2C2D3|nr:type I-C CRISPR-associated protein Cas5c [Candidatus Methylospira mobilis]WNV03154.1 type I-C CRISPR-associated protein Cas5c [Candidatus Methylospira mobilis]